MRSCLPERLVGAEVSHSASGLPYGEESSGKLDERSER